MNEKALLKVKDLNIYLNQIPIVQNISFTIHANECVGIVGESGSGKTLTAHAVAGLCKLKTTGSVEFNHYNLLNTAEKDLRNQFKNIGFVFQNPQGALNPLMRVGLQILETSSLLTKDEILGLLKDLGLKDPLKCFNSYPHELSGGMCQRIMIAIAIAKNPQLIVADEPTTALDVDTQMQILQVFKSLLKKQNTSLLLISHDFDVIEKICDKIIVMYAGVIIEAGNCIEIIKNPKHPYTKALLNAIPSHGMNKNQLLKSIPGAPPSLLTKSHLCSFYPRCEKKDERCLLSKPDLMPVDDRLVACFNSK